MQFLYVLVQSWMLPMVLDPPKTYTASIYEQAVRYDGIEQNLDLYEEITAKAAAKGVDILVFPEVGILPSAINRTLVRQHVDKSIPDPKTTVWNPCDEQTPGYPMTTRLSCIAKKNSIYLVANIADEQPCKPGEHCREDGIRLLNTNVAFNKNGLLVARYHKRHLFFESAHDRAPEPNYVYFDTEYGRFGFIVCFDVIYEEAVKLVENHHIDTVISPTYWVDELPFLSAIQMYSGWAKTNRVDVLLSNMHNPKHGAIGSGIFSWNRGVLNFTHDPANEPVLLTATLPATHEIQEEQERHVSSEPFLYMVTDMANYTSINLKKSVDNVTICNDGLCCSLEYNSSGPIEKYYFAARRGLHFVRNKYIFFEDVCTVFVCETNTEAYCKQIPLKPKTLFHHLHMKGNFSTKYVYPSVAGPDIQLAPSNSWVFDIDFNNNAEIVYKSGPPVLSANLYGRVYSKDPPYVQ